MKITGICAALAAAAMAAGCATAPEFTCPAQRNVTLPDGAVLIDVRTRKDYDAKHLEGAIFIPHDGVKAHVPGFVLDRGTPLYLYCGSGRRARMAQKDLDSIGYRNVINLCGIKAAEESLKK